MTWFEVAIVVILAMTVGAALSARGGLGDYTRHATPGPSRTGGRVLSGALKPMEKVSMASCPI